MGKTVLFAGSFDPITKGHENIALRASKLFDKVYVAVVTNGMKKYYFTAQQRFGFCLKTFGQISNIEVISYDNGLLAALYKELKADAIVKGVRNVTDYAYETDLYNINKSFQDDIETIFIPADSGLQHISSSMVHEMLKYGLALKASVPECVYMDIEENYRNNII